MSSSHKKKYTKFRQSREETEPKEIEHCLSPFQPFSTGKMMTIRQNPETKPQSLHRRDLEESGCIRVIAVEAGVPESRYIIAII